MCGGFIGKTLGLSSSAPPPAAAAPSAPTANDKAVTDAVEKQRSTEAQSQGREGTILSGAQGVSVGMEKLQKKKILGAVGKLGG